MFKYRIGSLSNLKQYFYLCWYVIADTKPPFLDGWVVFTKQAEPIMTLKDPTSDMDIISRRIFFGLRNS
uniref:Uncharacterized protein n=1 Tax=Nelumbo nucifera TaxID=4432 RepID=A0A822Z499_NELNU|nr:TPA_asm: hypothetical protein HUJ06_013686 [Nelumbo nucifera]